MVSYGEVGEETNQKFCVAIFFWIKKRTKCQPSRAKNPINLIFHNAICKMAIYKRHRKVAETELCVWTVIFLFIKTSAPPKTKLLLSFCSHPFIYANWCAACDIHHSEILFSRLFFSFHFSGNETLFDIKANINRNFLIYEWRDV